MNEEFISYIQSIGMTKPLISRVDYIFNFFQMVSPEEINDLFVSEYINADGNREFDSLLFFSSYYCMEAKQFIKVDDFDFVAIGNRVIYWNIKKDHYDFQKASEKSRMNLSAIIDQGTVIECKASKENCDILRDIFRKYILENFKYNPD